MNEAKPEVADDPYRSDAFDPEAVQKEALRQVQQLEADLSEARAKECPSPAAHQSKSAASASVADNNASSEERLMIADRVVVCCIWGWMSIFAMWGLSFAGYAAFEEISGSYPLYVAEIINQILISVALLMPFIGTLAILAVMGWYASPKFKQAVMMAVYPFVGLLVILRVIAVLARWLISHVFGLFFVATGFRHLNGYMVLTGHNKHECACPRCVAETVFGVLGCSIFLGCFILIAGSLGHSSSSNNWDFFNSTLGTAVLIFLSTNILSALYELGRWKMKKGEADKPAVVETIADKPVVVARVPEPLEEVKTPSAKVATTPLDTVQRLQEWQRFYEEVWGIKKDISQLLLPPHQDGFNWLVVMLEGMTARRIVNKMRERMKVWVYDESWLDKVESDREPTKDYAIWLRDRIEADEEFKNLSANDLKAKGVNCITLPERLMLELFYYWKTNQHLDISNWTLCAGSRYQDGLVPDVYWYADDGEVRVGWYNPAYAYSNLRSRQAVS